MDFPTSDWALAPVVVVDRDGVIRGWNDACAARTGRSASEVYGRPLRELVDDPSRESLRAALSKTDSTSTLDLVCAGTDGALHSMRLSSTPVRGGVGEVEAFVLTGLELSSEIGSFPASPSPWLWKDVVDRASWGVAIGAPDGRFVAVNATFARMHGTTPDRLVGTSIASIFTPEERPGLAARIREIHDRGAASFTSEHLRADGSRFPVLIDASAVKDDRGVVLYRAVYVQDITEGVRVETAFHELFEQASDGIFIAGLDGRYTTVNSAGHRMLGHERGTLVGKSIVDLIAPDQVPRLLQSKERMLGGETDVGEWELKRSDGTWLPVELSAKILSDGRWLAFVRDITERKQASAALAASEARIRQIVSSAADAIISIDEEDRILLFNAGAEAIFGHRAEAVLGRPLDLLLPERYRALHRARIAAFIASGDASRSMAARVPVRALRANGEEFSAQASISQIVDRGRRVLTVVLRDVSAEVRALEEARILGEIGTVLASSLDLAITVAELSRLTARTIADVCIVDVMREDRRRVVRAASRAEPRGDLLAGIENCVRDHEDCYPGSGVWSTGEPELVAVLGPEHLSHLHGGSPCATLLGTMSPVSLLAVPMRARGHLVGVLTLFAGTHAYDEHDLKLASEIASRAAMAIDNASLHEALTRAHEDVRERLRELQDAQEKIRTLTGLLPVCAWCGLIRDDDAGGTWKRFDQYVSEHSSAEVTHGICPSCAEKLEPRPK